MTSIDEDEFTRALSALSHSLLRGQQALASNSKTRIKASVALDEEHCLDWGKVGGAWVLTVVGEAGTKTRIKDSSLRLRLLAANRLCALFEKIGTNYAQKLVEVREAIRQVDKFISYLGVTIK